MNVDINKLVELNNLVALHFREKNLIVLNPEDEEHIPNLADDIIYDKIKWKLPKDLSKYVEELCKDSKLSTEEKILSIFEVICKNYVYDDNLISYIKKMDDDIFTLPDWYGRDIDSEWEKNRENHKRRVCYELSRYLAKSLTEILKNKNDFNICIHWNKNLTHYFVGLTCNEYSVTLDLDDFFYIKDLTRLKTGLTAKGITILVDKDNKFRNALNKFNEGKNEYAIIKMEEEVSNYETNSNIKSTDTENEDVTFLKKALEILTNKYKIDSQGIFEYMKEIVDIKLGATEREKLWKKIEGPTKEATRYIRCLLVNIDNKKFLIDVDKKILRPFDKEELERKRPDFIEYNSLSRGGFDYYDGT